MKKIYFVISYTGTPLSRLIKIYTKNKYAHISLALDKELDRLYSFGRHNPYIFFYGGFVREGINIGTFKRFKKTEVVIYSKEVEDEKYKKMEEFIAQMEIEKKKYKFNILGLFFVGLNRRIERKNKNTLYCAEFVRNVLNAGEIDASTLPQIIKPQDFMELEGLECVYEGLLRSYCP